MYTTVKLGPPRPIVGQLPNLMQLGGTETNRQNAGTVLERGPCRRAWGKLLAVLLTVCTGRYRVKKESIHDLPCVLAEKMEENLMNGA